MFARKESSQDHLGRADARAASRRSFLLKAGGGAALALAAELLPPRLARADTARSNSVMLRPLGGGQDDWPALMAVAATCAYQQPIYMLPGLNGEAWQCQSVVLTPSGTHIIGTPGTVIQCSLGAIPNVLNAPFVATSAASDKVATTTLASANVAGEALLLLRDPVPAAGLVRVQSSGGTGLRSMSYSVVSVTGTGPYLVTVDRPVLLQFQEGDPVQWLDSITGSITIEGNGMTISGSATRFIEFSGTNGCRVSGLTLVAGDTLDIVASFDVSGYDNHFSNLTVDGANLAGAGIALESQESSSVQQCTVRNAVGYGVALFDCAACSVTSVVSTSNQTGLALTSDGNMLGSTSCRVTGGSFFGNSQNGLVIDNGSSHCHVAGVSSDYNALFGILVGGTGTPTGNVIIGAECRGNGNSGFVVGAGAKGTVVQGLDAGSNLAAACNINDEVDLAGLTCDAGGGSGVIWLAPGNYSVRIRNVNASYGYGYFVNVSAGVTLDLAQAMASCFTDAAVGVVCSGSVSLSDTTIASATVGLQVLAGGTARLGNNVDLDGNDTALAASDGSYVSIGTVSASGAEAISVPWPTLRSTDRIVLVPLSYAGTPSAPPSVSVQPGVGFTVTGCDGDTSTYQYYVGGNA